MPKSQRNHRRRSRQCRGKRARNYVRTLARATANAQNADSQAALVLADARYSGALAAFQQDRHRS